MVGIATRLAAVRSRIEDAAARAGCTPARLVAVSKGHPLAAIEEAFACGQRDFGENYVQEWREKAVGLHQPGVVWHFLGRLQTNKAREVVGEVSLIHGVDRQGLIDALARRTQGVQEVLLQVNLVGEASKGGCSPDEVAPLLDAICSAPTLRCRGLMLIPPDREDPEDNRPLFRALRSLLMRERERLVGVDPEAAASLQELSMGMSDDFEVAAEEGATLVRVGSAIFGPRGS